MSARKRLLCIDDHEDTCDLVSSILEEYDVIAEHSNHDQIIAVGGQGVIRKDRLSQLLPVAVARTLEVKLFQDVGV